MYVSFPKENVQPPNLSLSLSLSLNISRALPSKCDNLSGITKRQSGLIIWKCDQWTLPVMQGKCHERRTPEDSRAYQLDLYSFGAQCTLKLMLRCRSVVNSGNSTMFPNVAVLKAQLQKSFTHNEFPSSIRAYISTVDYYYIN